MKEGYLIDPNHPAYPPQDVIEAAEKVGQWFDRHMVKDWKLGPVQERKDEGALRMLIFYCFLGVIAISIALALLAIWYISSDK